MRQTFINSFQKGEHKVIVIQTQAGKEGLTLSYNLIRTQWNLKIMLPDEIKSFDAVMSLRKELKHNNQDENFFNNNLDSNHKDLLKDIINNRKNNIENNSNS